MVKIAVIIPTLFEREDFLFQAIKSIRAAGDAHILLLSPDSPSIKKYEPLVDECVIEPDIGNLSSKLAFGINKLSSAYKFISWLGDDDLLKPDALTTAAGVLSTSNEIAMVYGGCDYVDNDGHRLFTNPSSSAASKFLRFGPQLIPQPGSLINRELLEAAGGLSSEFSLAFDFDLFVRLSRVGQLMHIPVTLAEFRWHPGSLSVKQRWLSATEASHVRRKYYRGTMKFLWPIWEPFVILATWIAGKALSLR